MSCIALLSSERAILCMQAYMCVSVWCVCVRAHAHPHVSVDVNLHPEINLKCPSTHLRQDPLFTAVRARLDGMQAS